MMVTPKDLFEATTQGAVEGIRYILSQGIDINSKNYNGDTVLHYVVCEIGYEKIVRFLISAGADVNITNKRGQTALKSLLDSCNSYEGVSISNMKALISAGSNVNTRSRFSKTALHVAASLKDVDFARYLIMQGAEVDAQDDYGLTPLIVALRYADLSMVEALLQAGADIRHYPHFITLPVSGSIYETISFDQISRLLKILLKYRADFSMQSKLGYSYINLAIFSGGINLIKALIEIAGVDVNSIYPYNNYTMFDVKCAGTTILHRACQLGRKDVVKVLLTHGAEINALDVKNQSPLHYAIDALDCQPQQKDSKYVELISYLLKHNADINTNSIQVLNILNFGSVNSKNVYKIIIEHLAKQQTAGLIINEELKKIISIIPLLKYYFEACNKELNKLKEQVFSLTSISLFNILMGNKKDLHQYSENQNIIADFYESDIICKYPIYGGFIQKRFLKIIHNKEVLRHTAILLSSWLPYNFGPDHLVIQKILSFCSFKSLRKLCQQTS